jgi:hypothetical protein
MNIKKTDIVTFVQFFGSALILLAIIVWVGSWFL